jgi:hypothetical protein
MKHIFQEGFNNYLLQTNHLIDLCMDFLYVLSFAVKYYVFAIVNVEKNKLDTESFWMEIENLNATDTAKQIEVF